MNCGIIVLTFNILCDTISNVGGENMNLYDELLNEITHLETPFKDISDYLMGKVYMAFKLKGITLEEASKLSALIQDMRRDFEQILYEASFAGRDYEEMKKEILK